MTTDWLSEDEADEPSWEDEPLDEVPCSGCGRPIYEEAQQCPHCGEWHTPSASSTLPATWRWIALMLLAAILFVIIWPLL